MVFTWYRSWRNWRGSSRDYAERENRWGNEGKPLFFFPSFSVLFFLFLSEIWFAIADWKVIRYLMENVRSHSTCRSCAGNGYFNGCRPIVLCLLADCENRHRPAVFAVRVWLYLVETTTNVVLPTRCNKSSYPRPLRATLPYSVHVPITVFQSLRIVKQKCVHRTRDKYILVHHPYIVCIYVYLCYPCYIIWLSCTWHFVKVTLGSNLFI